MVNLILDADYDIIADINEDSIVDILDIVTLVNWIMNTGSYEVAALEVFLGLLNVTGIINFCLYLMQMVKVFKCTNSI